MKFNLRVATAVIVVNLLFVSVQAQIKKNTHPFSLSVGYGYVTFGSTQNYSYSESLDTLDLIEHPSTRTLYVVTDRIIKPFYLKLEHQITFKSTFGCMLTYNANFISGNRVDSLYDMTLSTYNTQNHSIKKSSHRLRIQMCYSRYFFLTNKKFNTYWSTAIGISLSFSKVKFDNEKGFINQNFYGTGFFPLAIRTCYGVQYNFGDEMCLKSEIGLGGPLISLGIGMKI